MEIRACGARDIVDIHIGRGRAKKQAFVSPYVWRDMSFCVSSLQFGRSLHSLNTVKSYEILLQNGERLQVALDVNCCQLNRN